jgi:hypothetical protein
MSLSWQTQFAGPSGIGYHPYFSVASVDGQISAREKRYKYKYQYCITPPHE